MSDTANVAERLFDGTAQGMFDTVVGHLFEQGCPAIKDGVCSYRGVGGTRCAIGRLIPDRLYDESLEGQPVHSSRVMRAAFISDGLADLGIALQEAHDDPLNRDDRRDAGSFDKFKLTEALTHVAGRFGLNVAAIPVTPEIPD